LPTGRRTPSDYDLNVFINCSFDDKYAPLFDAILFSVYCCGFRPRCSLELDNAADIRIEKINKIIYECKFGIHDISCTELDPLNSLPRFNMPLELGLFLGAKRFGSKLQKEKIVIIFDKEQYRYQKYISDIAGQDIKGHKDDPNELIRAIRNSLNSAKIVSPIIGAQSIIDSYKNFQDVLPIIKSNLLIDDTDITFVDKTQLIEQYIMNFV
jgi:hypothetical protein